MESSLLPLLPEIDNVPPSDFFDPVPVVISWQHKMQRLSELLQDDQVRQVSAWFGGGRGALRLLLCMIRVTTVPHPLGGAEMLFYVSRDGVFCLIVLAIDDPIQPGIRPA